MQYKLTKTSPFEYEIILSNNSYQIASLKFSIFNNKIFKNWLLENCDLDDNSINDEYDNEHSENGIIILDEIIVSKQHRNCGIGKKMMQQFIKICDEKFNEIDTIYLLASFIEDNNENINKLVNFYKQFDFNIVCNYSISKGKIMKKYNI